MIANMYCVLCITSPFGRPSKARVIILLREALMGAYQYSPSGGHDGRISVLSFGRPLRAQVIILLREALKGACSHSPPGGP